MGFKGSRSAAHTLSHVKDREVPPWGLELELGESTLLYEPPLSLHQIVGAASCREFPGLA